MTTKEYAEAKWMWERGLGTREIAWTLCYSKSAITQLAYRNRHDFAARRRPITDEERGIVRELHEAGWSKRKIARAMHRAQKTIAMVLGEGMA